LSFDRQRILIRRRCSQFRIDLSNGKCSRSQRGNIRDGGGGFGGSDKPYNLTFGLQIRNLFNRTNFGTPVGNLSSNRFGQYTSIISGGFGGFGGGGFGGGGGDSAANRRVELTMRFNF
jgi:hypothetical protein